LTRILDEYGGELVIPAERLTASSAVARSNVQSKEGFQQTTPVFLDRALNQQIVRSGIRQ
jgi:hypothetical protein